MKFCNIASGSKGNCTYIEHDGSAIMIDDGLSLRRLMQQTNGLDIDFNKVKAIFVTHEHSDHIYGINSFTKKYNVPVYMNPNSINKCESKGGCIENAVPFVFDKKFNIGSLELDAFQLPHDAAYNQGFIVNDGNKKLVMATDLGFVSSDTYKMIVQGDFIYLESNYDSNMLKNGPYPLYLQQRIRGTRGHLDNEMSSDTMTKLVNDGKENFVLAHLSETNNTPIIVEKTLEEVFNRKGMKLTDVNYKIASQEKSIGVINI